MKKLIFTAFATSMLFLGGCATSSGAYTQSDVGNVQIIKRGTVVSAEMINAPDDGAGTILGAIAGGIIGAQFGGTNTDRALAGVGGAIAGGAAGNALNSSTAQKLTIQLDDGTEIQTIKNVNSNSPMSFRNGDRVRVYFEGSRVRNIALAQ